VTAGKHQPGQATQEQESWTIRQAQGRRLGAAHKGDNNKSMRGAIVMGDFPVSDRLERIHKSFMENNKMPGPNALQLIDVLYENLDLQPGMNILDR
jgi:hypothetical protein